MLRLQNYVAGNLICLMSKPVTLKGKEASNVIMCLGSPTTRFEGVMVKGTLSPRRLNSGVKMVLYCIELQDWSWVRRLGSGYLRTLFR